MDCDAIAEKWPKCALITEDNRATKERRYTLEYTFEISATCTYSAVEKLGLSRIIANLETTMNRELKEWVSQNA